jgi:hypothetical protein
MHASTTTPEWIRIDEAMALTGIRRTRLFQLLKGKRVKSASLAEPGQRGAVRLIHRQSLLDYIESRATGGE